MYTLDLIKPKQSDIAFESLTFPDGQPHLRLFLEKINTELPVCIRCRLRNPTDLFLLQLAKSVLDEAGFSQIDLDISYLLAARMDRVMQAGEPFALRVVADSLNALHFRKIRIFDPHSDVSTALIRRSFARDNVFLVKKALCSFFNCTESTLPFEQFVLVSPDAGALKKIYQVALALGGATVLEGRKKRDVSTGKLSGFHISPEGIEGKHCFIVDDICDGGGTFIGLAEQIRLHQPVSIQLVVSHGIFSKGMPLAGIDGIFTTNSFQEMQSKNGFEVILWH